MGQATLPWRWQKREAKDTLAESHRTVSLALYREEESTIKTPYVPDEIG